MSVRALWGDRILEEVFLPMDAPRTFTVGTARGVDFPLAHRSVGGDRFELVRAGPDGASVRVTPKMKAAVWTDGAWREVQGKDEISIAGADVATVDLGAIRFEIAERSGPRRVRGPIVADPSVFTVANVALVLFFLGAFALITAGTIQRGDEWDREGLGELPAPPASLQKLTAHLITPKATPNPLLNSTASDSAAHPVKRPLHDLPKSPGSSHAARPGAPMTAADVFGGAGIGKVLSNVGIGDEVRASLGGLRPSGVADLGLSGSMLRGGVDGGGDQPFARIGGIGVRGRSSGDSDYGQHVPLTGHKKTPTPEIDVTPPVVCGGGPCGLDRDLVRRVIHDHRAQLRYCYESELQRKPELGGKVTLSFVIAASGSVSAAATVSNELGDTQVARCLETRVRTWVFPKPSGAGSVSVTYPFVFKRAGE